MIGNRNYELERVASDFYLIRKRGRTVKTFEGPDAYDDAVEYIQDCVEDDRVYAHFYAE